MSLGPLSPVKYAFSVDADPNTAWQVRRMEIVEELSQPYSVTLDLSTDEEFADLEALLGSGCTLTVSRKQHERKVTGIIANAERTGRTAHLLTARV